MSASGVSFHDSHELDLYDDLLGTANAPNSHYSTINERITEYGQGIVVESTTYRLSDRPPRE